MAIKVIEIIDLDCTIPVPCVKNRDEMKTLEKANEDCFVLEFDPNDADLDFSKLSISEQNADDDLLLLAHKGEVACRDFPHPRHECARFPFRTTSQDNHCKHCYCYVCDLPAPCKMWVGNYNHCLAFDDKRWNTIRKLTREANKLQKKDACRPHMRHECVEFPFMTKSHGSHCELCYCYVCEVPAPCEKWVGSGIASHSHAINDKSWKTQRALKRKARNFQEKVEYADLRHPRHECEIFPFWTTSGNSHCKFCQCYVCELPAPCEMWVGNYYHCFAFDNETWNTLRKLTIKENKLQKKVECADLRHPRHACETFPFRTTSSKSHCKFCYCYVCDLPAPCEMWVGNYYHCYAFDNERWNAIKISTRQSIDGVTEPGGLM